MLRSAFSFLSENCGDLQHVSKMIQFDEKQCIIYIKVPSYVEVTLIHWFQIILIVIHSKNNLKETHFLNLYL